MMRLSFRGKMRAALRYIARESLALERMVRRGAPTTAMIAAAIDATTVKTADYCHRLEVAGLIELGPQGIGWVLTDDGKKEAIEHGLVDAA